MQELFEKIQMTDIEPDVILVGHNIRCDDNCDGGYGNCDSGNDCQTDCNCECNTDCPTDCES